jgi:hypothetical protein
MEEKALDTDSLYSCLKQAYSRRTAYAAGKSCLCPGMLLHSQTLALSYCFLAC